MKVKILILALSIVTLAGCGNDESPLGDTTGNSGPTALHVNGNICVTSRANDTRWEPNDRIGIYMLARETVEQNNKLYTTTDGSGKFTKPRPSTCRQTVRDAILSPIIPTRKILVTTVALIRSI